MKAKLIKTNNHYYLEQIPSKGIGGAVLEMMMGSTDGEGYYKLSKQNCDEIFGVVDVEKLATEVEENLDFREFCSTSFKLGFNKAMELNKDKVFTLEDVIKAIRFGFDVGFCSNSDNKLKRLGLSEDEFIQSLQQPTEIEVEIEMIPGMRVNGIQKPFPVKDSNGCLILKKI